jgi:hypothetical protein
MIQNVDIATSVMAEFNLSLASRTIIPNGIMNIQSIETVDIISPTDNKKGITKIPNEKKARQKEYIENYLHDIKRNNLPPYLSAIGWL